MISMLVVNTHTLIFCHAALTVDHFCMTICKRLNI